MTVLFLLETFYFSLLSYVCEAFNYHGQQLNQLNVCWNRAYYKAFHMNSWESVEQRQTLCERLDFVHMYGQCKLIFLSEFTELENAVPRACFNSINWSREFTLLCCQFDQ